ncbi:hypothetical protein Tco_1376847, partial [Tanacetum coccineum]
IDVGIYRFDETKEQRMKQEGLIKHYGIIQKMEDSTRCDKEGNKINIEDLLQKIKTKLMLIEDKMHVYNKQQFLIEDEASAGHHLWFMMIIGFLVSSSNLVTTTKRKDLVIPVLCQTKVSAARVKRSFVLMLLASKVFNAAYSRLGSYALGYKVIVILDKHKITMRETLLMSFTKGYVESNL